MNGCTRNVGKLMRYFEFSTRDVAFWGSLENHLLLEISRRLNQPPPLELFKQYGNWNKEHKHRWFNHECSFARIRVRLFSENGLAAELQSVHRPLFDMAVRCLTWMPADRPSTSQVLEEFQNLWHEPGVVPSSSSQGSAQLSTQRVFLERLQTNPATVVDLTISDSEHSDNVAVRPVPVKRKRIRIKSPELIQLKQQESTLSSTTLEMCKCHGNNCRSSRHSRGKQCQEPPASNSKFCIFCKCRSCNNCRRGYSGLCRSCQADELPWGLQLLREFGRLNLVASLQPVDVEALCALRAAMIQRHNQSDAVLEFIASWSKDPAFIKQLAHAAPKPNCTAKALLEHLHKTLRFLSDNGLQEAEAGHCIHGGRHTGLAFCMRWLGVASKVPKRPKSKDSPRSFLGGAPFVPFAPKQIIHNIGYGQLYSLELGKSSVGLDALIQAIRKSDSCASDGTPISWNEVHAQYGLWIQKITAKFSMGLTGTYVAPHILRKFLILNGDLPPLTVQEMEDLVPDEQDQLSKIPASLKDRGRLAQAVMCPDIYITCYNCQQLDVIIHLRTSVCCFFLKFCFSFSWR
jgi:hypothetical protein